MGGAPVQPCQGHKGGSPSQPCQGQKLSGASRRREAVHLVFLMHFSEYFANVHFGVTGVPAAPT